MGMIAAVLMGIGLIVSFVGGIWLLIVAFQTDLMWGLGSLFIPFVILIFAIMNWENARQPFLVNIGGAVIMIIGMALGGAAAG